MKMKFSTKDCNFCIFTTIFIVLGLLQNANSDTPKYCPNFCKCDLYNERNRADCSAKLLINPNVEIPGEVEILDLSYNDITTLDDTSFQSYHYLLYLTISHNGIDTIFLDAFAKLRLITAIDLSYNRLEYLDERLFESNHQLHSLNLEGNKFMSLQNKPLLRSTSLHTLNLRNSQLNYIYTKLFSGLPHLHHLDLSHNLMITINAAALRIPQQLQHIKLNENPWICDKAFKLTLQMLRLRGVNFELAECGLDKKHHEQQQHDDSREVEMFERMELLPSSVEQNDSTEHMESIVASNETTTQTWRRIPHRNIYEYYDDIEYDGQQTLLRNSTENEICTGSQISLCHRYRNCLEITTMLLGKISSKNQKTEEFTEQDLIFAFILGAGLGIAIMIVIIACTLMCKTCFDECKRKRKLKRELREATRMAAVIVGQPTVAQQSNDIPPQSPPPTVPRRSRNRRRPPTTTTTSAHAVMRYDDQAGHGRDNFISRLFGHPARHQYYRTINRNTATLVRRLSRSNLFNNRLSQHFVDRERGEDSPSSPNSPSGASSAPIFDNEITIVTSSTPLAVDRPETPPPNYADIVAIKECLNKK